VHPDGYFRAMMDLDRFWDLIEQARLKINASAGPEGYPVLNDCDALAEVLAELSPGDIVQFDQRFSERMLAAYQWDLWAALAIIEGAYGDDSFEHFRAELILLGREAFEAALRDADSLSDRQPLPWGMEGLIYVATRVYRQKTGKEFPYDAEGDVPSFPDNPAGEPWEEVDLPTRLPRLWATFNDERNAESDLPSPAVPAGPRVRIIDGHLQHQEGVLVGMDEVAGQVTVILPIFGQPTKVLLKRTQIEMM
jgi:hypothetical protein